MVSPDCWDESLHNQVKPYPTHHQDQGVPRVYNHGRVPLKIPFTPPAQVTTRHCIKGRLHPKEFNFCTKQFVGRESVSRCKFSAPTDSSVLTKSPFLWLRVEKKIYTDCFERKSLNFRRRWYLFSIFSNIFLFRSNGVVSKYHSIRILSAASLHGISNKTQ